MRRMLTRRTFIAGLAATAATPLLAQPVILASTAMQRDLDNLRAGLLALHPGLFRYQTAGAFERRFRALRAWAASPRPLGDFFLALAGFTAPIRCGHTYPNPNNQPRRTRDSLFAGRDRIPFAFTWLDRRMIVTRALAGEPLRPGDEVTALDGVPVRRILAALLPLARADGANDAKRLAQMAVLGNSDFEAFDVYRPLLFPPPEPGRVRVTLRQGAVRSMPAMTEAEREQGNATGDAPQWRFELADGVGRLVMPTWSLYDSAFDWRLFIDSAMDRLAAERARGLIVDIRTNEGGLSCGDRILARLIASPLARPAYRRRVRYRAAPAALRPFLVTYDERFRDWGARAVGPAPDGFYELAEEGPGESLIQPAGPRFAGRLAVLGDATNSSATFTFLQMVKENRLGTIVGAASGGNRRGINGNAYFFFRLAETGLEVDVPLVGEFPIAPQPDAGILPDIAAAPTRADIAAGRDPALESALALFA